jgi:hypothetical protein
MDADGRRRWRGLETMRVATQGRGDRALAYSMAGSVGAKGEVRGNGTVTIRLNIPKIGWLCDLHTESAGSFDWGFLPTG